MTDKEKTTLIERLKSIVSTWNEFDLVPDDQQKECREIGQQLCSIGGMTLMQDAYYEAKAKNRNASVLQAYWDGIGLWKW